MAELHVNNYVLDLAADDLEQFVGENIWMFEYKGKTYFHPDKFSAARNKTSDIWMDAADAPENVITSLGGLLAEKPKGGIFSGNGDSGGSKRLTISVPARQVGAAGGK